MNTSLDTRDPIERTGEACILAAKSAIERAKRYKTHLVVWKDGDVHHIPYEELDSIELNVTKTDSPPTSA
jgi:hypothetical protein